jgi:hypothetical protein
VRKRRFDDLEGHDAYRLIGVESSATPADIRRAYRRVMLTAHPDVGGPEHLAKLINCARDALLQDRTGYDEYRERLARRTAVPSSDPTRTGFADPTMDDEDAAVPQPASAGDPMAGWDEDWEDEDPWEDSEEGVGAPGQGADSPGAVGDWDDDRYPSDYPPAPAGPSLWDRFATPPMLLLSAIVVGIVLAGFLGQGGSTGTSSFPTSGLPTNYTFPPSVGLRTAVGLPPNIYQSLFPTVVPRLTRLLPPASSFLLPAHKCQVRANNRLWCSGSNLYGQLGTGDTDDHRPAVPVKGGRRWRSVTNGVRHTCGIQLDRTLWCWGSNRDGQLGLGKVKQSNVPRRVGSNRWLSVGAWFDQTCAVSTSHTLWCWGSSLLEPTVQAGGPVPKDSRIPKRYGKGITWQSVRGTDASLCARRPGHPDLCWPPA